MVSTSASTITLENVTGTPGNSFKANDLWICQVTDINNDLESGGTGSIVKSVRGTVTLVSGNSIIVSVESGSLDDLSQGDLIVAYGNTVDADRQAIMYRNVDRSEDNLIMRLQTEVNEFADLQAVGNTRVAFGDLNGYSELSSETFGFFAGKNAEGHILATNAGLFLKDGTNTLAEITSNTFKVGDSTNFLSFNGSAFDIQTNTFDLTAGSMTIDSTDGITIGTNDFFKQDKTFSFGGGVLSGDSDTVLITTTNFNVNTDNQNIVIGTSPALMTVGKLSSAEQGIKIDSSGITNQNYWKLGQGDVQFKVGDGTNFLSFNENAGTFEIETQAFRLDTTASGGGIDIDSTSQTIKLEDANRIRTQVDINNGAPTVSPTSHINDTTSHTFDSTLNGEYTTPFTIQVTDGDSIRVNVQATLDSISGTNANRRAQFQAKLLFSTTSGGTYNEVASAISRIFTSTEDGDDDTVSFSYHSYTSGFYKIQLDANAFDGDASDVATFDSDLIDMDSFPSVTRVSLDGVFVQNNDLQYAQFTRTKNELSGQIFLKNLPDSDPSISGQLYRDSSGNLKVSL